MAYEPGPDQRHTEQRPVPEAPKRSERRRCGTNERMAGIEGEIAVDPLRLLEADQEPDEPADVVADEAHAGQLEGVQQLENVVGDRLLLVTPPWGVRPPEAA